MPISLETEGPAVPTLELDISISVIYQITLKKHVDKIDQEPFFVKFISNLPKMLNTFGGSLPSVLCLSLTFCTVLPTWRCLLTIGG